MSAWFQVRWEPLFGSHFSQAALHYRSGEPTRKPVPEFLATAGCLRPCFFQRSRMESRLLFHSAFFLYDSHALSRFREETKMAKNKHLTLTERESIRQMLDSQASFKAIGAEIGRDCTTISKEVRAHRVFKKSGALGKAFNNCALRYKCDHRRLCEPCKSRRYCWSCGKCTTVCADFTEEKCSRLSQAPYVCSGCPDLKKCTLEKCFYRKR